MYNHFFGFKERPFKLVPNPAYLFLSKSHQEAMAHLVYAVGSGDGFVELTGEVGTGKTTVCRAFLEQLDENTEVAYILNPVLDPEEFIRTIIDEFGIPFVGNTTKELMDALNAFLIEKKAEGKDVLLLIDEAQNLTRDVLEQIRLISNLETTQSKLLQIVLVGQPELSLLLGSHDLRQLRQRITLSCRLHPLTYKETEKYIQHRIQIASGGTKELFSREAVRKIYKYSKGIPRLINIGCDRSLLTAYGLDLNRISGKATAVAIKELGGAEQDKRSGFHFNTKAIAALACGAAAIFLVAWYAPGITEKLTRTPSPSPVPMKQAEVIEPVQPGKSADKISVVEPQMDVKQTIVAEDLEPVVKVEKSLGSLFQEGSPYPFRESAFKTAMEIWDIDAEATYYLDETADDLSFFRLAAKQNGFVVYRIENGLNLVLKLNLPAILKFDHNESPQPVYLVLTGSAGEKLKFKGDGKGGVITALPHEVRDYWTGMAYIPWKNFFALTGTIPFDAPGESVITLKLLLKDIGFENIELSPQFDETTRLAIEGIQLKHDLPVDGVVGSMTKIALYNEKKSLKIPHLDEPDKADLSLPAELSGIKN